MTRTIYTEAEMLERALAILDYGSDEGGPYYEEATAVRSVIAERDRLRGVDRSIDGPQEL
jgi:hypothetical protein